MKPKPLLLYIILTNLLFISCYKEEEIPLTLDFEYTAVENFTIPAIIAINNRTSGADVYHWTFEGATPTTSDKKEPATIIYDTPGDYTIKLEAWNDVERKTKEIHIRIDSAVSIDFDVAIRVNDFVPAIIEITNKTRGASSYQWSFEGGSPETSTLPNPGEITFNTPGDHAITLNVSNGSASFTATKTITLREGLTPAFDIVPSFDDQDYEAPLLATLENHSVGGIHYKWTSTAGVIQNPTAESTTIQFDAPGDYEVSLLVDNDKETKSIAHTITVKPNSNLFTMTDVKFGVNAAHETIGCFYAPSLKDVLIENEVTNENGPLIDIVFFGINSTFSYCRFISPDSASYFSFDAIPQARRTYFVNDQQKSSVKMSSDEFTAMNTDAPLVMLDIKSNDTGIALFNSSIKPRIVLFETGDGRKGAIKVKEFVAAGTQSYIVVDIKVQKIKR